MESHAEGIYGETCLYSTERSSVSQAVRCSVVKIVTEGAGVLRVRGRHRAAVALNVKEETDVASVF